MSYSNKYLKYKTKYLDYKSKIYNSVKASFFKIGWADSNEVGKNYEFILGFTQA